MAISSWPVTLPQYPDREGFEERPKPQVIAFATESGRGKRRPRSATPMDTITAAFTVDVSLLPVFRTFFETELIKGTLPFAWPDPRDGISYRWWFDAEDPYRITHKAGPICVISCNLERMQ